MRCTIPEISWHNRDPVLSVDLQPGVHKNQNGETFWRLATAGTDSHVSIWHLTISENGVVNVECVSDLDRHQKAVNVVRFSPSGLFLASGDDDSIIILWKQKEELEFKDKLFNLNEDENLVNKEQWQSHQVLRGHIEDVHDLCWSPDSRYLASGSVDNTAIIWDTTKNGKTFLSDYKGFVQGVAWDPNNQYLCTMSSDRHCRLVDLKTKKTIQRVYKAKIPCPKGHFTEGKTLRLFYDDTFKSYVRRLTFSPDGSLIIVPSGIIEPLDSGERFSNTTVVFYRRNIKEPIMILPSLDEYTIAVRFCPMYFELREDGPEPLISLSYRMIFAVATNKSIRLYDTQQISPIAIVSNIHYTRLTDVAWSSDGRILVVSSTDGYCSIVHFEKNELGQEFQEKPILHSTELGEDEEVDENEEDRTEKKPFIDPGPDVAMDVDACEHISKNLTNQNLIQNIPLNPETNVSEREETTDIKLIYEDGPTCEEDVNEKTTPPKNEIEKPPFPIINKTPRRVKLITLSSPKHPKY